MTRPETGFFYEVKANVDSFSSFQPVLPYPPQEMFDFQLFHQVTKEHKCFMHFIHFAKVPVLIGGTSGEAATLMKYFLFTQ